MTSTLSHLEAGTGAGRSDEPAEVASLRRRAEELRTQLDETLDSFEDVTAAFHEVERTTG